jgi:hypothetical protein
VGCNGRKTNKQTILITDIVADIFKSIKIGLEGLSQHHIASLRYC